MDVSLDDFSVQIRNTSAGRNFGFSGRGRGNVRGRGRGVGRLKFQRVGINTASLRGGSGVSRGGIRTGKEAKNLTFTFQNKRGGFDARTKISASKKPLDAREKLVSKAKTTDARTKIATSQARKMGNPSSDARMIITSKTDGNGGYVKVRLGSGDHADSAPLTRTLQSRGLSGSLQIKNGSITRTIAGGNQPPSSLTFGEGGNPIIQIKNDQFYNPTSKVRLDNYYEEDEEYVCKPAKPATYLVEKTLTVKKPQLLPTHSFTQEMPKRRPQIVKKPAIIATRKPSPIRFDSSDSDVIDDTHRELKRKASSAPASGPLKFVKTTGYGSEVPSLSSDRPKIFKAASVQEEATPTEPLESTDGYRVIVSNLHSIVVQNDIIELFGAIGPIKRARLLKAGIAEVVYLNKDDVQKAIQKYHNRELDGLPMQVKLYTPPKPKKVAAEPVVGNAKDVEGPLRLGKDNPKKGSDLDVNILHRALFKTGTPNKTKVAFTVKV
ncbi:polymerase delta-interacting protein 3-like isoform X2 [Ostrea edulis]|uniref:polymerase delta-interacting protein 3-like isoform X2 n=1 Tax=Ostrea edulis TaxID=37623 RepID=UPI0024AFE0BD|nr:polymerase delta-interacting protein 3-like isoform X2 [Ostrea edulis]